ncbi:oxidoreductase, molybdopterin binding protein [Hyaloraphidium curvatum]|nr:oxidoreductase, molybdopterin binding protein [Hyaloraphidium curvatum]
MSSSIPGAFPEDDVAPPEEPAQLAIDAKAQREIDRKEKDAQTQKKKTFRKIEPEAGAHTSQENPRIPPGNHLSRRFQVLDLGHRPVIDMATWKLKVTSKLGAIELSLADIRALGEESYVCDVHCVTTWSALDVEWIGVPFSKIIERCRSIIPPNWQFLYEATVEGYTTNLPRKDVERADVYLVYGLDGQIPIPIEHGTVRILFPHLYLWKSAKWLTTVTFAEEDAPGFWEVRGYHRRANVWAEERYGAPEDTIAPLGPEFERMPVTA